MQEELESIAGVTQMSADAEQSLEKIDQCMKAAASVMVQVEVIKAKAEEALSALNEKLANVNALATQANAAGTKINDAQAVIATKSDHIQKAQEHADKVRADLDRLLTAASQQATETEGSKTRAQSAADTATQLAATVQSTKASTTADADSIKKLLESSKEAAKNTEGIAKISKSYEGRVTAYEQQLSTLEEQAKEQLRTIEGLLPGATSAGLAHAFDDRRKTFIDPSKRWQWLFIGSIVSIVILAVTGLWQVSHVNGDLTYEKLLLVWLSRLPVAGALLWLALHSSRESALAKRLEEDYGYKAAVASSFQGFHKQMSEVGVVAQDSPVAKLCEDTLVTIATPPGRIYEKHALTVSPSDELKGAATSVTEVVKSVKA